MILKKRYLFIFLIFSILTIVSCGINTSDITEIEIVNTTSGEKDSITSDSETAKDIIAAINKKEKADSEIPPLFEFEIYVKKGTKSDGYIMSFDVENQKVYLSKDDTVYEVKDNIAKDLLLNESFSFAYVYNTINRIYLYNNGEIKIPNIQYEWNYKNINDELKSETGMLSDGNENITIKKNDKFDIKFDVVPDTQITRVYFDGNVIYTGKNITEAINSIQNDGEYFIESEYRWNQKNDSAYGKQTMSFTANIDNPADFTVISNENYPGNILIISIDNLNKDETVNLKTNAVKTDINIYPYGEKFMSILPLDLYLSPNDYEISAVFNEGTNTEYVQTKILSVKKKEFKTQYLTVSEELNNSNNDYKSIQEFAQYVKPARMESVPKKLWEGQFIMPIEGKLTTDFAEIRYVNNEMSSSRHSGIDLAAPTGTDVKAPNNGKVTLAMNGLLSTGNTLVIDHGMGLFTSYYHLDTITVKVGDVVEKGSVIGTVGTTGFSTGPHLHYAVSIYNSYVNTYQVLSGIFD